MREAPADTELQLAESAPAEGEFIADHVPSAGRQLFVCGTWRPRDRLREAPSSLRMDAPFEKAQLLGAATCGGWRHGPGARGGEAGSAELCVRAAADAPEGVLCPHEPV